jgi:hypothetical protein
MTLILNEIHTLNGFNDTFIVAAADRRISNMNGSHRATRKKIFPISYFKGAISYFGLAIITYKNRELYIGEWLKAFISNNTHCVDLKSFSAKLRDELTQLVPENILREEPSGFHICGYNSKGIPDFWYFSNIGERQDYNYYKDLRNKYFTPSSHFLGRDAIEYGWNGSDKSSVSNQVRSYRNGDFRAHVIAWEALDDIFDKLAKFHDFRIPATPQQYREYVKL